MSKCYNHTKKYRREQNSKCGQHWRAFYRDDLGGFKSVTISRLQAIRLKIILSFKKENRIRSKKVHIIYCDNCGFRQEDKGQKVCLECQQ